MTSAEAPTAAREFGEAGGAADTVSNQDGPAKTRDLLSERSVISTGVVSLRSEDAGGARADVLRIVDVHRGQVTDEETSTDSEGDVQRSRMVLRVPVEDFYETVEELEQVAELESSDKSSENVSLQVIDTEVRIRAQERSLRRIEILFDRAQTVRDIVSIESELNRRQAELDSLQSHQSYLADQTSMSTITVYVEQQDQPAEKKEKADEAGFLAGLGGGWSALRSFATVVATIAGALLPWLVVVGILGVPIWFVTRHLLRRRPAGPVT
ncbi:MAG: DUF4349 domain-containing protein [Nocardioides sp.]